MNRPLKKVMTFAAAAGLLLIVVADTLTRASALEVRPIQITIVYDDYPFQAGLKTGYGFSCLVRGMEKTILFDQGDRAIQLFKDAYGDDYIPLGVGKDLRIL
jgi:hypothetical protein